jgi:lipopolysaccharide/colanic/teichoic acid biosynthesis glycosyltransferase
MGDLLRREGDELDLRDGIWLGEPVPAAVTIEPVVQPPAAHRSAYARIVKPLGDRLLALVMVIVLAPVLIAIAVGVRLTLGRPIVYRQVRMGKDGRTFVLWKFRTMLPDRRQRRVPVMVDLRVCHKREDDPRHVPFGTFLRRTSLDELPQLLNVLAGHMSLVGPRPELVELVEQYEPWQHQRHVVRPGLTGLWQVSGRGEGMMHDNVHLDLEYLQSLSLRTDLRIMLRTPRALLVRSGS